MHGEPPQGLGLIHGVGNSILPSCLCRYVSMCFFDPTLAYLRGLCLHTGIDRVAITARVAPFFKPVLPRISTYCPPQSPWNEKLGCAKKMLKGTH